MPHISSSFVILNDHHSNKQSSKKKVRKDSFFKKILKKMVPSRFLHHSTIKVPFLQMNTFDNPPVLPEISELFNSFNKAYKLDKPTHTSQEFEMGDTDNSSFKNSTLSTLVNDDLSEWLAILVNNSPTQKDSVKERLALAAAKRNAIKHNRWKEQMNFAWFETREMMQDGWQ